MDLKSSLASIWKYEINHQDGLQQLQNLMVASATSKIFPISKLNTVFQTKCNELRFNLVFSRFRSHLRSYSSAVVGYTMSKSES